MAKGWEVHPIPSSFHWSLTGIPSKREASLLLQASPLDQQSYPGSCRGHLGPLWGSPMQGRMITELSLSRKPAPLDHNVCKRQTKKKSWQQKEDGMLVHLCSPLTPPNSKTAQRKAGNTPKKCSRAGARVHDSSLGHLPLWEHR